MIKFSSAIVAQLTVGLPAPVPLRERLDAVVGLNIKSICENDYADPALNHCAHFVSHILGIEGDPTNCATLVPAASRRSIGRNVRVHEIFPRCPEAGEWCDRPGHLFSCFAFITYANGVDLARRTMQNVPNKHIGIFHTGFIYHYANSRDVVARDTPEDFEQRFRRVYGHTAARPVRLFYGTFPPGVGG